MTVDRKKVVKYHYGSRLAMTVAWIVPIFGLIVILSAGDILPRFPLTEEMEMATALIILAAGILVGGIMLFIIFHIIRGMNEIIATGEKVSAVIVNTFKSRRQYTITYSFEIDGEKYEGRTILARRMDTATEYEKGTVLEIYAAKNASGNMKSVPAMYV